MTRTRENDDSTNTQTTNNDTNTTMTRPKSDRTKTLENIESIKINIDDAVSALRKNCQNESRRGKLVIRVTPPYDDASEAHTHFSEKGRHYSGNPPHPLHIDPEAIVAGDYRGFGAYTWKSEYDFPCKIEHKSIYEKDAGDDVSWEEWWQQSIEIWEREIRNAIKQTESISFPHPDDLNSMISIPVEIEDE